MDKTTLTICKIINSILILGSLFIGYLIYFLIGREILVLFKKIKRSDVPVAHLNEKPHISLLCFITGFSVYPVIFITLMALGI